MLHASVTIRRLRWLFIFLMTGLIVLSPLAASADSSFFIMEKSEDASDGEDAELELECFDLIAPHTSGPLMLPPGSQDRVVSDFIKLLLSLTTVHLQRGPPLC